jgi:membrane associated rhomboid family serine protease
VSCAECGRGICPDCMVFGAVGIRCPDHATGAKVPAKHRARTRSRGFIADAGFVAKVLVGVNIGLYLLELATGGEITGIGSSIYENGFLAAPPIADGEWWRLVTAAFLHYGPLHLLLNMYALWFFGQALEAELGHWRFLLVYLVSGLAGSAGALLLDPNAATVGASGAIFGVLGAGAVLEMRRRYVFGGQALGFLVLSLIFTFAVPGISIGGHVGGLAGGALAMLAISRLDRRSPVLATVAVVAVGIASVLVAYSQVQNYA